MGIGSKIKGFFGRVWNGIKTGASKVGGFLKKVVAPVYNTLKPAINLIPGGNIAVSAIDTITNAASKIKDSLNGSGIKTGNT